MMFAEARWLWALAAVPLLVALEWLAARRADGAIRRLAGDRPQHALLLQLRPGERRIGAVLRILAFAALAVGAAGPQWGREVVRRAATGSDVIFMVDVSASMDARDVAPSRLDEARREALALLDRLEGSRVAVIAFAGDAVRLCPLTLDRSAARLTLEALSSGTVSTPGTDLGKALRMADRVVPSGRRDEQAVVLWTDGEDLENGARDALEETARTGIRVFAVGVGTPAGDVVPALDDQGHAVDVKRDESGSVVRSRLDEDLLRTIARRTRGAYFAASRPGGELPRLVASVGTLARSARGSKLVERPIARFRMFAVLAIVMLTLERTRARRRREAGREAGTPLHPERAAAAAILLAILVLPVARPARAQSAWAKGDRAFKAGHWAEADSLYALRLRHGGPDRVRVNRATARALAGDTTHSDPDLARLSNQPDGVGLTSGYNLGTLRGQRREYDPALAALRQVLERQPADADARWNYEVLLRRKQQEQHRPNQPPEPKPRSGGGGGGGGASNPSAGAPPSLPPSSGSPPPSSGHAAPGQMSRAEAERLLGALEEQSRSELQRQRKVPRATEHHGRDW
jgi:Ca-activated chloride channel family protein